MAESESISGPILHVVVVGFHHKKGCTVEYSYPPLIEGNPVESSELPAQWKHLPSLALPDGAHNHEEDTIFFHLESRDEQNETVFGISCYRQILATDLINRGTDVTRNTVQKSVCVLSKYPLFGLITAKLELITHAYFQERDFSQVSLLEETYKNLNMSVTGAKDDAQWFVGLSSREAVIQFKHKILVLFKLMMLERRVLFFGSPVKKLCNTLLSVLALHPGMIECGLKESACLTKASNCVASSLKITNIGNNMDSVDNFLEVQYNKESDRTTLESKLEDNAFIKNDAPKSDNQNQLEETLSDENKNIPHVDHKSSDNVSNDGERLTRELSVGSDVSERDISAVISRGRLASDKRKVLDNKGHEIVCEDPSHKEQACDVSQITHIEAIQRLSSQDGDEAMLSSSPKVSSGPLDNINDITQVEPVQGLRVDVTQPIPINVQDLDTPESIQQIDNEDLFSFEEDKLLLTMEGTDTSSTRTPDSDIPDLSIGGTSVDPDKKGHGLYIATSDPMNNMFNSEDSFQDISLLSDKDTPKSELAPVPIIARKDSQSSINSSNSIKSNNSNISSKTMLLKGKLTSVFGFKGGQKQEVEQKSESPEIIERPLSPTTLNLDDFGLPLSIYTKGSLCHPYLSLQYYDLLVDVNVRCLVIGATNMLFKHKTALTDVIVEFDENKIEIHDPELRKQLNLSTADLRFADYIVQTVHEDQGDIFVDDTSWEGGDEWLRAQFKTYTLSLLATTLSDDEKALDDYNSHFMNAWRTTHNYRMWQNTPHDAIKQVEPGHPFRGQVNVADMKLRLAHTMQYTTGGKRINAAVMSTGKAMSQTGKVVGGALTNAKSAVSSWLGWPRNQPENST
ncbi:unnamed protein product [Owenia fusiformis]|uniref:Uncharacterized protein n=1 Tax=Owenia fusiformis TaxID=6347 RepID=A0A8J1Y3M3_OWEFU|nr:unnamed protein product [Owenia fusiformis]